MVLAGAVLVGGGTFSPWVSIRQSLLGWTYIYGWELRYARAPHFPVAFIPMACALAAGTIGLASLRRKGVLRHAVGPAMLTLGFLAFTYVSFAVGHLRDVLRRQPTVELVEPGLGLLVIPVGALLIGGAALFADRASRAERLRRLEGWAIAALVEFTVLNTSGSGLIPPLFLGVTVLGLVWSAYRTFAGNDTDR